MARIEFLGSPMDSLSMTETVDIIENKVAQVVIKNKVSGIQQELASFTKQNSYTAAIVEDYSTLLKAEERKFFLGESSLFLVNYREAKLIETKLKAIDLENKFFKSKASLFKAAILVIR